MVKFLLKLQAELSNVTDLEPVDTVDSPFEYTFQIECTKCRTTHDKNISINRFEKHEISGSRGDASFVFRCKECKNESSATIERTKNVFTIEDKKWIPILEIDARGIDFQQFIPLGLFKAVGLDTNTKFNDIEIDEGEWYDVDDKNNEEVSITEVKWEISRS
ncbi:unnamed protein product [Candida verbasci]|uniref:DUF866-domain-containing protein n=1 Tax=Candida verbasci TaxID=1227364 RepID=A0A9W4XB39_9ASCO|nr:unnamed protein product [Candida verbasci]